MEKTGPEPCSFNSSLDLARPRATACGQTWRRMGCTQREALPKRKHPPTHHRTLDGQLLNASLCLLHEFNDMQ